MRRSERLSNNNHCNSRLTLWKLSLVAKDRDPGKKRKDLPDGSSFITGQYMHFDWLPKALSARNAAKGKFLFATDKRSYGCSFESLKVSFPNRKLYASILIL